MTPEAESMAGAPWFIKINGKRVWNKMGQTLYTGPECVERVNSYSSGRRL